jgi:hypothetical protein
VRGDGTVAMPSALVESGRVVSDKAGSKRWNARFRELCAVRQRAQRRLFHRRLGGTSILEISLAPRYEQSPLHRMHKCMPDFAGCLFRRTAEAEPLVCSCACRP